MNKDTKDFIKSKFTFPNSGTVNVLKYKNVTNHSFDESKLFLQDEKLWRQLTTQDKLSCLSSIANNISKEHGIQNFDIALFDMNILQKTLYGMVGGGSSAPDKMIALNKNYLSKPYKAINLVSHEMRHMYQQEYLNGNVEALNIEETLQWNEASTKSGTSIKDYYTNPLEVDARKYAEEFAIKNELPSISYEKQIDTFINPFKTIKDFINSKLKKTPLLKDGKDKCPDKLTISQKTNSWDLSPEEISKVHSSQVELANKFNNNNLPKEKLAPEIDENEK